MYDIKIFLEDNGEFGARVNAGKEFVYGVGKNKEELMENISEGLSISFENKEKNKNVGRLFSYLNSDKKDLVCH